MTHAPQMTGTKRCSKCGEEKPVLCFAAAKGLVGGLEGFCRVCRSRLSKQRRVASKLHAPIIVNPTGGDNRGPVHTFEEWKELGR